MLWYRGLMTNNLHEMAARCEADMAKVREQLERAPTRRERRHLRHRIRMLQQIQNWAKSRRGYQREARG